MINNNQTKCYYIKWIEGEQPHAGYKAVIDCENILEQIGYKAFAINSSIKYKGKYIRIPKLWIIKMFRYFFIPKKSIVVIRHPIVVYPIYQKIIRLAKKVKNFKWIYLIHDLDSVRLYEQKKYRNKRIKSDELFMNTADAIIVHNGHMKQYCIKKYENIENKLVALELFDYIPSKNKLKLKERHLQENGMYCVTVAGNLKPSKAGYLYKFIDVLSDNVHLNLYGAGFKVDKCSKQSTADSCYTLKGTFMPEELIEKLEGSFGIVWDGDSIKECGGTVGQYLKINNPHKVSLYIICEMPIIIWSQAALAEFVITNKIGIAVDSLEQLGNVLQNVTEEEYFEYCNNIKRIAKKARKGVFLKEAMGKAEKIIYNI
ncbi:MAG: hypothetical protein NC489_31650 [Ruminococcus flavefaciens]|nr:hypothetical protein [Ruminococcus flavefaciens]